MEEADDLYDLNPANTQQITAVKHAHFQTTPWTATLTTTPGVAGNSLAFPATYTQRESKLNRVWGIRPAKVCHASKLQSLFGASKPQSLKAAKPLPYPTPESLKA